MSTLAPPIQALLDLFQRDLAQVRFGDIDARRLSALAADVEAAAEALAAHEATASRLRSTLTESQDILMQQAQRALAFARIYAENDDELAAKLSQIALPRAGKRAKAEPNTKQPAVSAEEATQAPAEAAVAPVPADIPAAEAPSASSPGSAPARRGKRREATRVVARDDDAFDSASDA
jgi:hypothetical protein